MELPLLKLFGIDAFQLVYDVFIDFLCVFTSLFFHSLISVRVFSCVCGYDVTGTVRCV